MALNYKNIYESALGLDVEQRGNVILGMPPTLTEQADPGSNVFASTMAYNAPVITFMPGEARINKSAQNFYKDVLQADKANPSQINTLDKIISKSDKRLFGFEPAVNDFLQVYSTMVARLYSRLYGDKNLTNLQDTTSSMMNNFGGFHIWQNADTQITENISNEFQESLLSNLNNTQSQIQREISNIFQNAAAMTGMMADEVQAEQVGSGVVSQSGASTYQGTRLLLPKLWAGSQFLRQYSLQFKFETLYGDEESILRDVYTPFFALLTLALPRNKQNNQSLYQEPFLVRAYCPGYFIVDMGVVTNMSIKKTSGDDTWNYRGLTTSIECSMEITDIYPVMMTSNQSFLLDANDSMSYYVDALAGISYKEIKTDGTLRQLLAEISSRSISGVQSAVQGATAYGVNLLANAQTFFRYNR